MLLTRPAVMTRSRSPCGDGRVAGPDGEAGSKIDMQCTAPGGRQVFA
jgi:hypothetical protein